MRNERNIVYIIESLRLKTGTFITEKNNSISYSIKLIVNRDLVMLRQLHQIKVDKNLNYYIFVREDTKISPHS